MGAPPCANHATEALSSLNEPATPDHRQFHGIPDASLGLHEARRFKAHAFFLKYPGIIPIHHPITWKVIRWKIIPLFSHCLFFEKTKKKISFQVNRSIRSSLKTETTRGLFWSPTLATRNVLAGWGSQNGIPVHIRMYKVSLNYSSHSSHTFFTSETWWTWWSGSWEKQLLPFLHFST